MDYYKLIELSTNLLNVIIIPVLIYVVRIEKRLTKGDIVLKRVERDCPIFNLGVCPSKDLK